MNPTPERVRPGTPEPVRPGTAEQLARLAHFAALEHPDAEQLDYLALWLLGPVGDSQAKWALWQQLKEGDAQRLWYLISNDYDDRDCDELTADVYAHEWFANADAELVRRAELTADRLREQIEGAVRLARYRAAEARRASRTAVAS